MTVGGMGFIPERLLMMMMMIIGSYYYRITRGLPVRIWPGTIQVSRSHACILSVIHYHISTIIILLVLLVFIHHRYRDLRVPTALTGHVSA